MKRRVTTRVHRVYLGSPVLHQRLDHLGRAERGGPVEGAVLRRLRVEGRVNVEAGAKKFVHLLVAENK